MRNSAKYCVFAEFLRKKRGEKYRSAREFNTRVKIGVSYPQYSRYEAGEQLPSLVQALSIGAALGVPDLETTLEWNLAQLSQEQAKAAGEIEALLGSIRSDGTPARPSGSHAVGLDEVIVFNRSHRDLFLKDPAYRDIFTYVNAFHANEEITADKISKALKLSPKKLEAMLENLVELGVILKKGKLYSAAKSNFYFPDDVDFFELRQQNVRHNLEKVLDQMTYPDLREKKALRGLLTRELTPAQLGWILGQIEGLLGKIVELPEDPEASTIYSVCAVVGQRFSR